MSERAALTGFADAVGQSQAVFHAAMMALARPGIVQTLPAGDITPPPPLLPGVAALALTLCDFETTLWLDPAFSDGSGIADYLRFYSGARLVMDPLQAQFALVGAPLELSSFEVFAQGTLDYPDRSTTLILQVDSLDAASVASLTGPGVDGEASLCVTPLPMDFVVRARANHALFPRGVDMLFVAGDKLVGLPRSTKVES